jgi:hypothetical protein
MLAITLVSLFLLVVIVVGAIVTFEDIIALHPVCAESVQIVYHEEEQADLVHVFEIPEDMVFWGEELMTEIWFDQIDPAFEVEVCEEHAFSINALHGAMVVFWSEMDKAAQIVEETLALDQLCDELNNEREVEEDGLASLFFWQGDLASLES